MRPIVGADEEGATSEGFDYYTYGKYCGWASAGLKTIYYLSNFGDYWMQGIFNFLPELTLFVLDMLVEFAGFVLEEDGIISEGTYNIIYQLVYELYAAEYTQMIAFWPIYVTMEYLPPWSEGLPFFNDIAEMKFAYIPNTWDFSHLAIFYTMAWYLKVAAIVLKEMGHPFLKFDELNIAYIAAWNFLNDWWSVEFLGDALEYPVGVLIIQLPWFALAWFLFDGRWHLNFGPQSMFAD